MRFNNPGRDRRPSMPVSRTVTSSWNSGGSSRSCVCAVGVQIEDREPHEAAVHEQENTKIVSMSIIDTIDLGVPVPLVWAPCARYDLWFASADPRCESVSSNSPSRDAVPERGGRRLPPPCPLARAR